MHVEKILYQMGSLDASMAQNEDLKGDDEEGDPTTESGTI